MNLSTGNGIRIGRGLAAIFAAFAFAFVALAQAVTTTTVQGTVYFANGQPGAGTVQIQWPSFTTAGGQAIAAGSTSVTIGSDGSLSVNLAPNQDASPAGLFYTVTYYLSNGTTNTEYWVVPDAAQATLAQVRAQVMPSSQAIHTVSKAYVDQAIANISQSGLAPTGGTLTGPLYLAGDPTASLQAADKHYVDTSVAQTVPLSGATLTGALSGPAVSASVNNVINVMAPPYNAKGDCTTDDQAAIQAALTTAQANTSSNTVVYFPTPPGGCYLTSQLNWYGVSLRGEAGNNQNGQTWQGVTLKGKPGQDILHTGDPDSTTSVPTRLWSIENIRFVLDDSVDASGSAGNFAHRWPGKWIGDGAMTSGSTTLTSTYAQFTCGDIGQAVLVKGAGAGGADLSTTISSVSPCYTSVAPTTAALAAAASTTVSAARAYIANANMPVTQQIGNCAIAMDNSDGNSANWLGSAPTRNSLYDNLHNVNFSTTSGALQGQNDSCAIYFQGVYMPYGLDARNLNITRFTYGIVEGLNDVNPLGASGNNVGVGADYQLFDHGDWVGKYPWISYNGGENEIKGVQLYATAGPQLLQVKSVSETGGGRWKIEAPEFEQPSGSVSGWRIDLNLNTLINTQLASNAANIPAYIEGYNNRCVECAGPQTLNLGGYNNDVQMTFGPFTVNDSGYGNRVYSMNNSAGYAGQTPTLPVAQNATKGIEPWGRLSADFIRSGNLNSPYMNLEDLLILPADVRWNGGVGTVVYPDPTSITGKYGYTNGTYSVMGFGNPIASALTGNTYNYTIGGVGAGKANVPATKIILYASVKCPSVTSYTLTVRSNGATVATATPTCNSSGYTVGSVTADLSSYAGQNFGFAIGSGSGEVDWAYVAVRPYQADYNGYQPLNKAGDTMTGPLILNADPTAALGAATKQYSDQKVPLAGGTMTGPLYLSADPTTGTQAATKNYVDTHGGGAAVLVSWGPDTSGTGGNAFVQNYTTYYTFQLYGNITLNTLRYRITTADNTANLYDFGVYSVSGTTATLVTDIGPTAGTTFAASTGFKTANFSSVKTLLPGVYLVAITTNCASSCAVLAGSAVGMFSLYNSNPTSGPSTGGQLPSSITGLTSASSNNGSSFTGFDVY
ncbi:MAG TPA: glycosyl hydrolase family 28-related protein [Terracidiphilus sp.]|nr:glycosyl hydrolase family 28-related protein [Terracidiphilus sp.]